MSIIVSAPGKIHLLGEHTVVYGKPALLTAINRRVYVSIEEKDQKSILRPIRQAQGKLHSGQEIKNQNEILKIKNAVEDVVKKKFQLEKLPEYSIIIRSQLPIGSGLGSSSAVAVAYIGALLFFFRKVWNPQFTNELAYEVEKKFHGNPSGADNTVVTFGGFIWYRREFEFLKSIWQLPFRPSPMIIDKFFLIDSGKPQETTGEMVEWVKSKIKNQKSKIMKIFSEQEELTKQITIALKEGNESQIIESMKNGERNLELLGVVGRKATSMIRLIEEKGGAAKITGAGGVKDGSGMLLVYHKNSTVLKELTKQKQWKIINIRLGEEGVRREL